MLNISTRSKAKRPLPFSRSQVLSSGIPMWRSKAVMMMAFFLFLSLAVRAFWIMGPGNAFFANEGRKRFQRTLTLAASRGRILDRNGALLAISLPARAIWCNPEDIPNDISEDKLRGLASLVELPYQEVRRRIDSTKDFVFLNRQVEESVARAVAALNIPGVHELPSWKRYYPDGDETAHIVGFTNIEDVGQEGIELAFNKALTGQPGQRQVIKDRLGNIIEDAEGPFDPPHNGTDISLTIDKRIQHITSLALQRAVFENKAKAGGAVVLDARSGEILALANWPTFDPNNRARLSGEQLRNRAFTDSFEPGSTIKPVTIALALDKRVVAPETHFDTSPGTMSIGPAVIHDTSNHGTISVGEIIAYSSNVGTAKIALQMQSQDMWENFIKMGLGQPPRIQFPGASAGRLRNYKNWKPIEQATMAYGYGLSVSLVQLARTYTAFATDGTIAPLSISAGDKGMGRVRVMSERTAEEVRRMLEMTVELKGATGTMAKVPGFRVGAKTGTARKQEGKGYASGKYRAVFVGMAPMTAPRIVVAVMIDEPSGHSVYGGPVAGPVFAEVTGGALQALNVPPDRTFSSQIAAN